MRWVPSGSEILLGDEKVKRAMHRVLSSISDPRNINLRGGKKVKDPTVYQQLEFSWVITEYFQTKIRVRQIYFLEINMHDGCLTGAELNQADREQVYRYTFLCTRLYVVSLKID